MERDINSSYYKGDVASCYVQISVDYELYGGVSAWYSTVLIPGHDIKKITFSKIRVAYNNVYRKILGVSRRASASGKFVSNDIPNFEAFLRKPIHSFTTRLSSSSNKLICAIEQFWIMKSVIWKTWEKTMYS